MKPGLGEHYRSDGLGPAVPDSSRRPAAFTLIELMVVIAVLGVLLSTLAAGLASARTRSQEVVCASNIRQLVLANQLYAQDQDDRHCPGAAEFLANLRRWHGTRGGPSEPFRPTGGALTPYLGEEGGIRRCPAFPSSADGFEAASGAYGYNNDYVGVQLGSRPDGTVAIVTDLSGVSTEAITRPAETVMFTDAAFGAHAGVIEYSFAHARFRPTAADRRFDPSVHFRHRGFANVAWCDGHVQRRELSFTWTSGLYAIDPADHESGWFGSADDNTYFDLR